MVGLQLIILLAQQVAFGYAELYEMTLISLYLKIGSINFLLDYR